MNGYLMQERSIIRGMAIFIESFSQENKHGVVFEDDGETGYFYAVEQYPEGQGFSILDALHIYEAEDGGGAADSAGGTAAVDAEGAGSGTGERPSSTLLIIWSRDWEKCALVIDGSCHAVYDFKIRGGYNINEFPPPNAIWTRGDRKLTNELIRSLF